MLICFLFISLANSAKILEYKFYSNFGQLFYDYSLNSQYGMNGNTKSKENTDSLSTDRGIYQGASDIVQLPSNEFQTALFTFPSTFSIYQWVMSTSQGTFSVFLRKLSETNFFIIKFKNGKFVQFKVVYGSKDSGYLEHTSSSSQSWQLIGLKLSELKFEMSVNSEYCFQYSLSTTYSEASYASRSAYIGLKYDGGEGFNGFIWNFVIYDTIESHTIMMGSNSNSNSNSCIIGSCSCTFSVNYDIYVNKCLNPQEKTSMNSQGKSCSCSSSSCLNSLCLECPSTCASSSCTVTSNTVTCLSVSIPENPNNCSTGQYLEGTSTCKSCHASCSSCTGPDVCITCKYLNSVSASIGCSCITGYWGASPVLSDAGCSKCYDECYSCSSSSSCITCIAEKALPNTSSNGCSCIPGYYSSGLLTSADSCIQCYSDCETCSKALICDKCKDSFSVPDTVKGCKCKDGYFNSSLTGMCEKCADECVSCSETGLCISCVTSNALPWTNTTGCYCDTGHFLNSSFLDQDGCVKCNQGCEKCSGSGLDECEKCSKAMLNGLCFEFCPYGYSMCLDTCCPSEDFNNILRYTFSSVGSVYYDEINKIPAEVGYNQQSETNSLSSVLSVSSRGVYMNGQGGLRVDTVHNKYIFTQKFTISAWINPFIESFHLAYKPIDSNSLFKLSLSSLSLCFDFLIKDSNFLGCSEKLSTINTWNHILAILDYSSQTSLSLTINGKDSELFSGPLEKFIGSYNTSFYIGSDNFFSNSFEGFLYIFEMFLSAPLINELVSVSEDICEVYPKDQSCISTCILTEFELDANKGSCETCQDECDQGCKNATQCSLCEDDHCVSCENFKKKSCIECEKGFEVKDKLCVQCWETTFYDVKSKSCKTCEGLCVTCESKYKCLSCKDNSKLNSKSACVCDKGFHLNQTSCIRNFFSMVMSVQENNTINLIFNESLKETLDKNSVKIKANGLRSFKVFEKSKRIFICVLVFETDVSEGDTAEISLPESLESEENSIIDKTFYETTLFMTSNVKDNDKINHEKEKSITLAQQGTIAGVTVNGASSMVKGDLNSIFTFLNTAEMFFTVYFFDHTMYEPLSAFLIELRVQSKIPNLFGYFVHEHQGVPLPAKYRRFGFKTNLLMLNCGIQFMFLCVFFALFILLLIIHRFLKHEFLETILQKFKFSVFLRIWIQSYYELLHASTVGLKYNTFDSIVQIIDAILSFFIIVFFNQALEIFALYFILLIIWKRKKISDLEQIKIFKIKFATFFEEFKDTDLKVWFFYFLFVIRRLLLVCLITFGVDDTFQLSFACTFAVCMSFYVLMSQCFTYTSINVFHVLNELLIAAFYWIFLSRSIYFSHLSWTDISDKCILIVMIAWGMNIILSIYLMVRKIVDYIVETIRKKRITRVSHIEPHINETGESNKKKKYENFFE